MTEAEISYIKEHRTVWKELEEEVECFGKMLKKRGRRGKQPLTKERIDRFVLVYNMTANHLAYVRTNFGEGETSDYLNRLLTTAHGIIYTNTEIKKKRFGSFILFGIPATFRRTQLFFWIALAAMLLPALIAFIYTSVDYRNAFAFVDAETAENLRQEGNYDSFDWAYNTYEAVYIGQNNITICLEAFAGGATLGLFTVYVLVENGLLLGALAGVCHQKNADLFFWSLILPHGITELFAIALSGAAGFIIAYAFINPGSDSRKNSLIKKSRDALKLELLVVFLLIISAVIEGFFTPLALPYAAKYGFALMMLCLLIIYLSLRKPEKT